MTAAIFEWSQTLRLLLAVRVNEARKLRLRADVSAGNTKADADQSPVCSVVRLSLSVTKPEWKASDRGCWRESGVLGDFGVYSRM